MAHSKQKNLSPTELADDWKLLVSAKVLIPEEKTAEIKKKYPDRVIRQPTRKEISPVWLVFAKVVSQENENDVLHVCRCCFEPFQRGNKTSISNLLRHARQCVSREMEAFHGVVSAPTQRGFTGQLHAYSSPYDSHNSGPEYWNDLEPAAKRPRISSNYVVVAETLPHEKLYSLMSDLVREARLPLDFFSSSPAKKFFGTIFPQLPLPSEYDLALIARESQKESNFGIQNSQSVFIDMETVESTLQK